jgi:hemolysin III
VGSRLCARETTAQSGRTDLPRNAVEPGGAGDFLCPAERIADRIVHLAGVTAAFPSLVWLFRRAADTHAPGLTAPLVVYGLALLGMLVASTLYNAAAPGRTKTVLRRLDHAMIFVMIAGTYTPFAVWAVRPGVGLPLLVTVWTTAAVGIAFKLACPLGCDRLFLALYLGMGWMVLAVLRTLFAVLPNTALMLLFGGGVVYSLGAFLQARRGFRFQNAIWHGMVLAGAGFHMGAVACLLTDRP